MSDPRHDATHAALMRAAFFGQLPDGDPRLKTLDACAECRRDLARLRATVAELDNAAGDERDAVVEAAAVQDAADGALADQALRRIAAAEPFAFLPVSAEPRPALSRRGPWLAALAAVAAALLAYVAFRGGEDVDERVGEPGLLLGDEDGPELVEPIGEGASPALFRWSYHAHDSGYGYDLRIYDADAARTTAPVLHLKDLTTDTWKPTDEQRARLPQRVLWAVDALNAYGDVLASSPEAAASF